MEQFLFALERESNQRKHDQETLLLKLEVELLKFDRRLPPKRSDDEPPQLGG